MTQLSDYIAAQAEWSARTFGPGRRTKGIIEHIKKELVEIEESGGAPDEWVDVVILGLDGLWRSIQDRQTTGIEREIGMVAFNARDVLNAKQAVNLARQWPDWRTRTQDEPIEHVRDGRIRYLTREQRLKMDPPFPPEPGYCPYPKIHAADCECGGMGGPR